MKIGIDISQIIYNTGVSVYTKMLIGNLSEFDKSNRYILFGGSFRRLDEIRKFVNTLPKNNFQKKLYPLPPSLLDLLWNRMHIGRMDLFTGKLDVLHTSDWSEPRSKAFKVTTIHDLSPILYPKLTDSRIVDTQKARLNWVFKESDRIIVPSEFTKSDLIKLGVKENIIRVIPEAVDPFFARSNNSEIEALKRKIKLTSDYILSVGVGPRKNTKNIIKAFEMVKPGKNLKLLIVGFDHYGYSENRNVRFLGQVSKTDLRTLYSGASLLLYPSLVEGFGIPILEAFACGCPVVTSNCSSMPEVAGKAAIYVEPKDVHSIANGIITALKQRSSLVKKGKTRIKQFSWQNTAKMTLDVYNESQK